MSLPALDRLLALDPIVVAALGTCLRDAGYTSEVIGTAESVPRHLLDPVRRPLVHDILIRQGTPGARLALLFSYKEAVRLADLEPVLGPDLLRVMLDCGLIEADPDNPGQARSRFHLLPTQGLYFLADALDAGGEAVMGPAQITVPLLRFAAELPGRSVLDIGCGAGSIALAAAQRGASAIGTDLNQRAIELSRFNALLNCLKADFLPGDLTAPVRGRRFDLVLAQPPFVMQPQETASATYLHGGAFGDELAFRLLGELPAILAPGGNAIVFFDTGKREGPSFMQRVRAALGGAAVDLVILLAEGMLPDVVAIGYASIEDPTLGPQFAEAAIRYRRHLADLGVTGFHHGLVLLRAPRESGGSARYSIQLQINSVSAVSPSWLLGLFASLDLAALPDVEILTRAVTPPPDVRWIEERATPDSSIEPACRIRFPSANPMPDLEVPAAAFPLFEILGSSPSVATAIEQYAAVCDCSADEVRPEVLSFVREGLARGALRPMAPS
jgi:2-polyprenyl-3-methyl-5-hydroxy-6-metoxy-1,4-benzoquinol methylase